MFWNRKPDAPAKVDLDALKRANVQQERDKEAARLSLQRSVRELKKLTDPDMVDLVFGRDR